MQQSTSQKLQSFLPCRGRDWTRAESLCCPAFWSFPTNGIAACCASPSTLPLGIFRTAARVVPSLINPSGVSASFSRLPIASMSHWRTSTIFELTGSSGSDASSRVRKAPYCWSLPSTLTNARYSPCMCVSSCTCVTSFAPSFGNLARAS